MSIHNEGGGVKKEDSDRTIALELRRPDEEIEAVGRRKEVSPDMSNGSYSAMEATDGEAPRMEES